MSEYNVKKERKKKLDGLITAFFGNQKQYDSLEGNKIVRGIADLSGIAGGLYLASKGAQLESLSGLTTFSAGFTTFTYFLYDFIVWTSSKGKRPSNIGLIRDWWSERKKRITEKKRLDKIRKDTLAIIERDVTFQGLNFGDYALVFLKKETLNKNVLLKMLKKVHYDSQYLPTVGVELGYSTSIDKEIIKLLNDPTYVLENHMPKCYSEPEKSEIRILPTNPYTFRWLLHESMKKAPSINATVQVCVGDVFEERMFYIFLSLYFSHISCVLPMKKGQGIADSIGFPGAYIGQTINKFGFIENRAQTNYLVFHSDKASEIADSCFHAAKLHALDPEQFANFEEELREYFQFQKLRVKHENHTYFVKDDSINVLMKREWLLRDTHNIAAYQMPKMLMTYGVNKAKKNLGIKHLEDQVQTIKEEDKQKLLKINKDVKRIIEKHINTCPLDIIYRTTLEEVLNID